MRENVKLVVARQIHSKEDAFVFESSLTLREIMSVSTPSLPHKHNGSNLSLLPLLQGLSTTAFSCFNLKMLSLPVSLPL